MNAGGVDKSCKSNAGGWTLETSNWLYNTSMASFQELEVYQRAQELFPKVYALVRRWDRLDQREMRSQIIRAANSIHANIAVRTCQIDSGLQTLYFNRAGFM